MGERKAQNKYIPNDFDPSKLGKRKKGDKDKNKRNDVRAMLPFSCQCSECQSFLYRGKKFDSRKEPTGENYLGIKIWRLLFKCPTCGQQITFLTDPENSDYKMERGGKRLFEVKRTVNELAAAGKGKDEDGSGILEEETSAAATSTTGTTNKLDAMAELEARAKKSKEEMESLELLDRIKTINRRNESVDVAKILEAKYAGTQCMNSAEQEALLEEDAQDSLIARQAFLKAAAEVKMPVVKEDQQPATAANLASNIGPRKSSLLQGMGLVKKRKTAGHALPTVPAIATTTSPGPSDNALNFLSAYGDDSDSESDK